MKFKTILTQLFLLFAIFGYSQPTTVYTCKGGTVTADIRQEFTPQQITDRNNYTMSTYSYLGITFLANSSYQYNCHAYAWHLREGNTNKVWINNANPQVGSCYPQTHNIDKYWTENCFIKVCNEADADKLHYYCGDHSAVKSTTNPGYYESKWGELAVVRHTKTGVPYSDPTNSVNYYASTKISGDASNLCTGTRVFTVKNISGATYSWTYSNTLSVVGATNINQVTVQRNGSSNGAAWAEVQISIPCNGSSATRRIDFTVGISTITGYYRNNYGQNTPLVKKYEGVNYVEPNVSSTAIVTNPELATATWSLINGSCNYWTQNQGPDGNLLVMNLPQGADVDFRLTNNGTCIQEFDFLFFAQSPYGGYYQISPNPTKDNITVSVDEEKLATQKLAKSSDQDIREIDILDKTGMVRLKQFYGVGTRQINMDVSGLMPGVYIVRIFDGKQWTAIKLIKE